MIPPKKWNLMFTWIDTVLNKLNAHPLYIEILPVRPHENVFAAMIFTFIISFSDSSCNSLFIYFCFVPPRSEEISVKTPQFESKRNSLPM